jgi:hypothetical protein
MTSSTFGTKTCTTLKIIKECEHYILSEITWLHISDIQIP